MHNDAHVQIYKNMSLSHITHQINPCMSFTWYLHNQTTFQSFTMLIFTQGIGIELLSDQHRSGSPFRYRGLNSNRIQHLFKVGLLLPSEESGGPPHYLLDRGVSPVSIRCKIPNFPNQSHLSLPGDSAPTPGHAYSLVPQTKGPCIQVQFDFVLQQEIHSQYHRIL